MSEYKIMECSIPLNNLNINQISDRRFSNLKMAPGKAHKLAIPTEAEARKLTIIGHKPREF